MKLTNQRVHILPCFIGAGDPSAHWSCDHSILPPFIGAGDHKCTLELCIPATGERNIYTLMGKAADPVAESHIVIECQARKVATKTIAVRRATKRVVAGLVC